VFPFLKYASDLMVNKFGVDQGLRYPGFRPEKTGSNRTGIQNIKAPAGN